MRMTKSFLKKKKITKWKQASLKQASRCLHTAGPWAPRPPACVIRWHRPKTLLSTCHPLFSVFRPGQAGHLAASSTLRARPSRLQRHARPAPPTPPAPAPRGPSVTLSASAAPPPAEGCCASAEQAAMGSLRGLRLAAGETRGCGRQEGASPVGVSYLLHPWEDRSD